MFILKSEFSFDAAHKLEGHNGKCANLHGHRWRCIVQVQKEDLIKEGSSKDMVIDFTDLKKDLKSIENMFDHKLIFEGPDFVVGEEEVCVPFRPTAEKFAQFLYQYIERLGYEVTDVAVYETPNNCVTYTERRNCSC